MKKNIIFASCLALLTGLAVASNSSNFGIKEVKAADYTPVSGDAVIDMTKDWSKNPDGQNFSVYFYDDTDDEVSGWGDYVFGGFGVEMVKVHYELDFTPTNMIAVRYPNTLTKAEWEQKTNRFDGKWDQTPNLVFEENPFIIIEEGNQATVAKPYFHGCPHGDDSEAWGNNGYFTNVKLNSSSHCEYYTSKYFDTNELFGIKIKESDWFINYTISPFIDDEENHPFVYDSGTNSIKCVTPGEYVVYFDHQNESLYINLRSYAEADEWSQIFLGVTDSDGKCPYTLSHWGDSKLLFEDYEFSSEARDVLLYVEHLEPEEETSTFIEKAMQRYDYILITYGSDMYEDFIGRISEHSLPQPLHLGLLHNETAATMIIVVGVLALTTTIGVAFVMIRKRKHQ